MRNSRCPNCSSKLSPNCREHGRRSGEQSTAVARCALHHSVSCAPAAAEQANKWDATLVRTWCSCDC